MTLANNSTILILGGAGFIGKALSCKLASLGYHIRIYDNLSSQVHGHNPFPLDWLSHSNIEFVRASILDRAMLEKSLSDVETIVHLAAETGTGQSMYDICHYNNVNSQGTALLMDILTNSDNLNVKRIILSSSRSVYGEGAYSNTSEPKANTRIYPNTRDLNSLSMHKWDPICPDTGKALIPLASIETDHINCESIYAATKFAQEELIRISAVSLGIDYCIFRLQNVYGEGQSLSNPYTGILSIFSTRIRLQKSLPIFEDGLETRDFVHISDVVRAFVSAIESQNPIASIINVGSGIGTTVLDVAKNLVSLFNSTVPITITGNFRLGDIRHNRADITRLNSKLDISPRTSLSEGLQKFVDWVKTQPLADDNLDKANNELLKRNLMK